MKAISIENMALNCFCQNCEPMQTIDSRKQTKLISFCCYERRLWSKSAQFTKHELRMKNCRFFYILTFDIITDNNEQFACMDNNLWRMKDQADFFAIFCRLHPPVCFYIKITKKAGTISTSTTYARTTCK